MPGKSVRNSFIDMYVCVASHSPVGGSVGHVEEEGTA